MGAILGIGLTHYPPLAYADRDMAGFLRLALGSPQVPAEMKDLRRWPERMRAEWADQLGAAAAHRKRLVEAFRKIRAEIDEFRPDFVLLWGDDQYENFREEGVPPFAIFITDEMPSTPWKPTPEDLEGGANVWGEPEDRVFRIKAHREAARYLTTRLLEADFDVAYAYRTRHPKGAPHAHMHTLLYLDYDRKGFEYPIVPVHVNSFGSAVISHKGGPLYLDPDIEPDPPSPSPGRFFELGAATARIIRESPWRAAFIASGSWSHAFLVARHHYLWPDSAFDRARLEELKQGHHACWRDLTTAELVDAGEQEFVQWICLAGAMSELRRGPAEIIDYVETDIFNSTKCFAIFRDEAQGRERSWYER